VRGFGLRILVRIGAGLTGAFCGAGGVAGAVSSVQDSTAGFATAEAAAAAARPFVVIAGTGATIYGFITYSGLPRLVKAADDAFTKIDVLLKQLFDAMPHLARECAAHMRQESRPLLDLARSRSEWTVAQSSAEKWKVGADAHLALKWIADIAGFKSRPLFAAPAEERIPAPTNFKRSPRL